jgi:hypothetical protein
MVAVTCEPFKLEGGVEACRIEEIREAAVIPKTWVWTKFGFAIATLHFGYGRNEWSFPDSICTASR